MDGLWCYLSRTFFKQLAENQGVIQDVARNLEYILKVAYTDKSFAFSLKTERFMTKVTFVILEDNRKRRIDPNHQYQ
jgi:hypothetical protein